MQGSRPDSSITYPELIFGSPADHAFYAFSSITAIWGQGAALPPILDTATHGRSTQQAPAEKTDKDKETLGVWAVIKSTKSDISSFDV